MSADMWLLTPETHWEECWLCKGAGVDPQRGDECYDCHGAGKTEESDELWLGNVTYNLGGMWRAVGWNFDGIEALLASDIGEAALAAFDRLKSDPDRFRAMNPPNGWGTYDGLVEFFDGLVAAIEEHPEAVVHTWL